MLSHKVRKTKCPQCGKEVKFVEGEPLPPYYPFCSLRCKLIDLGYWLEEKYRVKENLNGRIRK